MNEKSIKKYNYESNTTSENIDCVIFYDSTISLENLTTTIDGKTYAIFTLDYESHEILERNKISHRSSDNFLMKNELVNIQERSYYFAKWAENKDIEPDLIYSDINLGKLPYVEFHYGLVQILKKILSVKNIINSHLGKEYFCSRVNYKILELFIKEVNIIPSESAREKNFLYDNIRIPFKFFGLTTSFYISKENYVRIRDFIEEVFVQFFNWKNKKINNSNKQNVLVEFDTIRIKELLKKDSKSCLLIYNRRRPTIWNFESLLALKNSNAYVLTKKRLITYDSNIKNDVKSNIDRFSVFIKKNEFFEKFFVINDICFWKIIKDDFVKLHVKRMNEAVFEINLAKIMFEKLKIGSVTVWSESGFSEQILIGLAKSYGIPTNLVQHGIYHDTDEAFRYNEFYGVLPILTNNFLSWGEITSNYVRKFCLDKNIINIGSLFYDSVKCIDSSEGYMLLVTTSPRRNIVFELTDESIRKYEDCIKQICNICKKLNKKLVIKMHPDQDEREIVDIVKTIDKNIRIVKYANILDLISSCFCLLSIDKSTTMLEALIMGKPIIAIRTKEPELGMPSIFQSNATPYLKIEDLEEHLQKIIINDTYRKQIIENGKNYVDRFLTNPGTASDSFLAFIYNTYH